MLPPVGFERYKPWYAAFRQGGAADPISILGDKLAAWYESDPSTLFTTSIGETPVTAAGDPVGLRVNRVSGGPDATQTTPTARPLWQTGPNRLVYDGVDDALQVTVPTGGWSGTFFNATTQGVIVGTYSVPAGTYQLPTNPLYRDSLNNDVGIILCDGVASAEEIAKVVQWLKDNHSAGSGVYSGTLSGWMRGRTDITSLDESTLGVGLVANFDGTWLGCAGLASFPLLDVSAGTTFYRAWYGCTGLTNFPLLDVSAGTNFNQSWLGCTGLANFPLLDVSAGTIFNRAWNGCTGLANFPANFFDGCLATNFTDAFTSTNLTETSIDNILVSIESNGTSGGTFGQTGGTAPSATGEAAIDALRLRGWTVTVTGGY